MKAKLITAAIAAMLTTPVIAEEISNTDHQQEATALQASKPKPRKDFGYFDVALTASEAGKQDLYGYNLALSLQFGKYVYAGFDYNKSGTDFLASGSTISTKKPFAGAILPVHRDIALYGGYGLVRNSYNDGNELELGAHLNFTPETIIKLSYLKQNLDFTDDSGFKISYATKISSSVAAFGEYRTLDDKEIKLGFRAYFH